MNHRDAETQRGEFYAAKLTLLLFVLSVPPCLCGSVASAAEDPPNVIFILCDNLGYGDVGPFGNQVHRTPNLDRMAAEGRKFTHYYSASGVCSPSRAALMTGCYPLRVGLQKGSFAAVLQPLDPLGIAADETTLAELFKNAGYATAAFGKWHLGDQPEFLPTRHGFDAYFGIPYSEDMTGDKRPGWPPLPLLRGEIVVEAPADRDSLTQRYTREVQGFMLRNRHRPFFVYLPHAVPGSEKTSFASAEFRDQSKNGRYGDAVEEMDWSVGVILDTLKEFDLDRRTLVVWTSDNGAVRRDPSQGTNAPLGGWGYSTNEGGMRMPMIARWPGRIPAGTECDELCTMMDWLPTAAGLVGAKLPTDRTIDGRDLLPLLEGQDGAKSAYDAFYYYQADQLQAVRSGRWKLHLPLEKPLRLGKSGEPRPAALYDVVADPGETKDLIADNPEVVARLTAAAEQARAELGDLGRPGRSVRQPGRAQNPTPREMPK